MMYGCTYNCAIGKIVLESDGECLTYLGFEKGRNIPDDAAKKADSTNFPTVLSDSCRWLDEYFSGNIPGFTPKLAFVGTQFQTKVWNILGTIPYGKTVTYGDIAQIIARERSIGKMSARAVGNAVGKNPISIIVPCHRVVGKADIGGFEYGLEIKRKLLRIEGITQY